MADPEPQRRIDTAPLAASSWIGVVSQMCEPTHTTNMPILQLLVAKGGKALKYARSIIQADIGAIRYYFSTTVWLPSIAVAILHASVLAWSGTLITWLLNANFSLTEVIVAIVVGSLFEMGSTVSWTLTGTLRTAILSLLPKSLTKMLRKRINYSVIGASTSAPSTSPRWAICGLFLVLVPAVIAVFFLNRHIADMPPTPAAPSPLTDFVWLALESVSAVAAVTSAFAEWMR
ncbi:hypothetical protein MMC22_009414 [Lobaria immixta]|nr:hypothetical protein [Lobaria immixta]